MAADGLPVQVACRVLGVSESGYYRWLTAPPSERQVRHAWLTDVIRQVHADSRGTYGARRVHAELTLGHGLIVGSQQVSLLMRRAGLQGLSGRPRWRRAPNLPTATDLVDRQFAPRAARPVVGHRHHRAPDPRGQGVLRRGPRRLLAPGRGLVHRRLTDRSTGHQRSRDGHRLPQASTRRHRDPQRPGHPDQVQGVVATLPSNGPGGVR
jgi:hypothetical protein